MNNLSEEAIPIPPQDFNVIEFYLIGCGGNGSYMAEVVTDIAVVLQQQHKEVGVTFIDPDTVAPQNIPRQRFSEPEIGLNKAQCLALYHAARRGIAITAIPEVFTAEMVKRVYNNLNVVIGCVDGQFNGRAEISEVLKRNEPGALPGVWWLDLGNHTESGQIILGSAPSINHLKTAFDLTGQCTYTPSPALIHPDLLEPGLPSTDQDLSCAQIAILNEQSQSVNMMCAAIAKDYLVRLLLGGRLTKWATYFNLARGEAISRFTSYQDYQSIIQHRKSKPS